MTFTVLQGDALHLPLADGSVHCCVTSPPYWNLRDYNVPGQLGLEPTPEEYVANMVAVFREVWRVLRPDGTAWCNLGDSYATGTTAGPQQSPNPGVGANRPEAQNSVPRCGTPDGLKPKDLIGIPWRVALALQADGWWLRSDVIWEKPNAMPESVRDRPTCAHEHVFLLTKSPRYYYDVEAVAEPAITTGRWPGIGPQHAAARDRGEAYKDMTVRRTRNRRDVWTINTEPYSGAHFATMPEALAEVCIMAGTSERGCCPECGAPWERVVERGLVNTEGWGAATKDHTGNLQGSNAILRNGNGRAGDSVSRTLGWQPTCGCPEHEPVPCVVLDPFGGAGTTMLVADRLGRHGVGVELNGDYCRMARRRCYEDAPLLAYAARGEA